MNGMDIWKNCLDVDFMIFRYFCASICLRKKKLMQCTFFEENFKQSNFPRFHTCSHFCLDIQIYFLHQLLFAYQSKVLFFYPISKYRNVMYRIKPNFSIKNHGLCLSVVNFILFVKCTVNFGYK